MASRISWFVVVASFFASPLLSPPGAFAQNPPAAKKTQVIVPYDGPEIFARLLHHAELKPLPNLDCLEEAIPAERTVVIVFGDPQPLKILDDTLHKGLQGFLDRGGALLVASDRQFSQQVIRSLAWGAFRFHEGNIVNNESNFLGQRNCPTISEKRRPEHPIFRGLTQSLATNCPGWIEHRENHLQTLAYLPRRSLPEIAHKSINIDEIAREASLSRPYLVGTLDHDKERVLLVGGHGLFMNCLMIRNDIDNRRFALNAINWLKGDGPSARTHVLFLNETKALTDFTLPLIGPPKIPMPPVEAMNRIIDAVQKEAIVQKLVDNTIGPEPIVRVLLILATFAALVYGLKKYFQGRYLLERTPLFVGIPQVRTTPLHKQQMRELASRDQFGEPAQALARDWFRAYAGIDLSSGAPDLAFEVRAGLFKRRKLSKHVESLWTLAKGEHPANWTGKKLRDLVGFLEELSLAVAGGEVIFDGQQSHGREKIVK